MDIASAIEKTLFITNTFIEQKIAVDELQLIQQSLESLKKKFSKKNIKQDAAEKELTRLQEQLLKALPFVTSILPKQDSGTLATVNGDIEKLYQLMWEKQSQKETDAGVAGSGEGWISGLLAKFSGGSTDLFGYLNKNDQGNESLSEILKTLFGEHSAERPKQKAKPPMPEMAGAEPPEPQAVPAPAAAPADFYLPAKGKILYDIPDNMKVNKQQKCIVRIAKDELIVKDDDNFTDAVKIDITLSGTMKVELIDIAEPPHFNIKTISSAEQEVDAESYTEWLFWVTPLMNGVFDLILKVSIIKTVDGKEKRKDLVFEKAVNITADDMAAPSQAMTFVDTPTTNNDASNSNLKNLADEKNIKVIDPPGVFISYAHKDKVYFDIFSDNLRSQSGWNIWTDRNIEIGSDWFTRIKDSIKDSNFAVLLVSSDFISSGFIKQNEFADFMQLENSKPGFAFLPVLLRDVDFTKWKELAALQFFVAYGDEYGVPELKAKMIPFAKLCRFDNNNQLIPNDNIDTYFKNFVAKVEKDWLRGRKN